MNKPEFIPTDSSESGSSQAEKPLKLELDDSRRLTGKNLVWDNVGAILDTFVSGIDKQQVVDCWLLHVNALLEQVGWAHEKTAYRIFEDGISFLISAPMDALYAATEINEAAWALCCSELNNIPSDGSYSALIKKLQTMIKEEADPALLKFIHQAEIHNTACLVDDDEVSLGYGASSQTWPVNSLPDLNEIYWQQYQPIPTAMITGTNGKSTSVRLCSEMVKLSGKCCGVTSTDFIKVGDTIIDKGDYSGPGGARTLLRHPETEIALLEVARGGLLRRGLAVPHIDAALITNIAEDHFGQYGINNLDALTQAKCIVAKALTTGTLILNADDPQLVKISDSFNHNIVWFSLDKTNPVLVKHQANKGTICYLDNGTMFYQNDNQITEVLAVNNVPMTFKGAARHNIQNALGAIALAIALNIDLRSIRQALTQFSSDIDDNPGRGNQFQIKGAQVILDFAHNTHSMKAMAETVREMPAKRKILMLSAAGDRSDHDIESMTEAAMQMKPELLVIAEIKDYLRGRELNQVPKLIARKAIEIGQLKENIIFTTEPVEGVKLILKQLEADQLALIMALSQRQQIFELLQELQA